MWVRIREIWLGLLFDLSSNKQVTIDCDGYITPVVETYYTGPDFSKWKRGQDRQPMELQLVEHENVQTPSPDVFYVVCVKETARRTITEYEQLFFDPKILKVSLDPQVFYFTKRMHEIDPTRILVSVKDVGRGVWTVANCIAIVVLTVILYWISKVIINKLSMMDPVFAEFNIVSSNLQKFKDVPERSMPQCTICFDEFQIEDDVRVLECKHYFHPMCIDRWLIGHSKRCPCCRGNIEINERG